MQARKAYLETGYTKPHEMLYELTPLLRLNFLNPVALTQAKLMTLS